MADKDTTPVLNPPRPSNAGLIAGLQELVGEEFNKISSPPVAALSARTTNPPAADPNKEEPPKADDPSAKETAEHDDKTVPEFDPDAAPAPKKEEDDTPTGLSEKARADWKGLRETARKAREESERLQKRVAELESATNKEEVESLKQLVTDYEQRLIVTNIERHPQFQAHYEGRTNALIDTAKQVAGEKVAAILRLPEGEHRTALLRDAYAELDPVSQSQVGSILVQINTLNRERSQELANSKQSFQALQARQQEQQKAQTEQSKRVLEDTITRWSDPEKGSPLLRAAEGDKEGAERAEKIKNQARATFAGELDTPSMAKAALWAAKGPELAKNLKAAVAENQSLRQQIAELSKAKPSLNGGPTNTPPALKPNAGWIETVMSEIGKNESTRHL